MLCCEASAEERGAGNLHATFCGSWRWVTAASDPVRAAATCALLPDRATRRGEVSTVHKLQKLLVKSWYARLLAVRRITQDNRGRHTAGIDGVKSLTPPQRWRLANELGLDGKASALRRTWIPQRGSTTDKRPLGIPTQADRARQTLVRQALEPQWEAKLSAHAYGFRPGRSCHDAIGAIFTTIRYRPQ